MSFYIAAIEKLRTMYIKSIIYIFLAGTLFSGCMKPPSSTGSLGFADTRRIVIVGENVNSDIAGYYQKKYDALVWFTPFQGRIAYKAHNLLQSGIGPSVGMRSLIRELKSINYSIGQWQIFVPGIAENYFLATLKSMEDHSLSKARGMVVLIDSKGNKDIEIYLKRVTDGSFFVNYEFGKDVNVSEDSGNEKSAPERDRTSNP